MPCRRFSCASGYTSVMRYAALLRGINVGGNKKVSMADLKKHLEKAGYDNVKTLLASGNVLLDADEKDPTKLRTTLEQLLEKKFGFPIPVIVRTVDQLKALEKTNPFKGIAVTKETRLYVTFLSAKPKSTLKIPYESEEKDMRILRVTDGEVISVFLVTEKYGTTDGMAVIEREFGKNVTTRNWNTVLKLLG